MSYPIYRTNGKMRGERLTVKVFKTDDDRHRFLNKQYDNEWAIRPATFGGFAMPTKAGVYASAGGAWHNVKHLDASLLAHI